MKDKETSCLRILAIDDDPTALDLYQEILSPKTLTPSFDVMSCHRGDEAVKMVRVAIEENKPFAMAFIDVRLPLGPDGVWTAEHIRALDPNIQITMVTGYSDVDPADIACRVSPVEKLFYIRKPLDPQEIRQFAFALGAKWHTERRLRKIYAELEDRVKERTAELAKTNEELRIEITKRKQAEEVLRESEEKYKSLFENANDAIFIADTKTGTILDANKQAEQLIGRPRQEIIGMHQSKLHPPHYAKYYKDKFRKHVQKGRIFDLGAEVIKKDGSTIPVVISASVISLRGKEVIQGIFRDITQEREIFDLREEIETRKLIGKAKGILMKRHKITEAEAMRQIQKESRRQNRKIKKIAQAIVSLD